MYINQNNDHKVTKNIFLTLGSKSNECILKRQHQQNVFLWRKNG